MTSRKLSTVFTCLAFIFAIFIGSANADIMSVPHDDLHFTLGDVDSMYVQLSSGGLGPEEALIPFSLHFSDNAPTGIMTKIKIRIDFDAGNLEYTGVTPTAAWPGVINDDTPTHDPGNGVICLEFVQAASVPIPTTPTQYAILTFEAVCQEELTVTDITFDRQSNDNFVDTYDAGTYSHSPQNWDDGSVTIIDYLATYEIDEVTANVGDVNILVPVYGTTNFNMLGVHHQIHYDTTILSFVEGVYDYTTFPYLSSGSSISESSTGSISALVYTLLRYPVAPVTDQELYYLKFNIKPGASDDCTSALEFVYDSALIFVYVSHEPGYMVCFDLKSCIETSDYINGEVTIPLYSADLLCEYDGDPVVKTGSPQFLDFDVSMLNNFPAGDYSDLSGNGGAGIVFDLPDYFTHYDLVENSGDPDFHPMTYSNGARILYTYQEYNSGRTNYWPPGTVYDHLYEETFIFNESAFDPDYDNRTIKPTFRDEYSSQNWETFVEDTTGTVTTDSANGKLTWESIGAVVKMGEFYSPYTISNDRYVDQPLYIRANFDIGHFYVKVTVDGAVNIESITLEQPGVQRTIINSKTVSFYYNGSSTFHSATGNTYLKIATIEWEVDCRAPTGKMSANKPERPWMPHIVIGTISFTNAYVEDDQDYDHFLDLEPHNLRCLYCDDGQSHQAQKDDMTGFPVAFQLNANYPNPFNPQTVVSYDVPSTEHVLIQVYNVLGQKIRTLVDQVMAPGTHEVLWDGVDENGIKVASGIYLCNLQVQDANYSMKMMLMK